MKHYGLFLIVALLSGCSLFTYDSPIANVLVEQQGQTAIDRSEMQDTCKGFSVDEAQVYAFYEHATTSQTITPAAYTDFSPCYVQGRALLYGTEYQWTLKVGGMAHFFNQEKSIYKICGVRCCNKVQGVC